MRIELYGGPGDRRVYDLATPFHDTFLVPLPLSPHEWRAIDTGGVTGGIVGRIAVYQLARRVTGELAYRYVRTDER